MTPPLTLAMARAMKDRRPRAIFAEIDHPDGTARLWTGLGAKNWNGYTWTGAGTLGAITAVKQTSEPAVQEINFVLSGVDAATLALLSGEVRNRSGKAWLACLDYKDDVIADPYQFVESELDYQTLKADEDGTATIMITARAGFYTLDRGIDEGWTPENQKKRYPDDTGLDLIPGLQNQDIQWTAS